MMMAESMFNQVVTLLLIVSRSNTWIIWFQHQKVVQMKISTSSAQKGSNIASWQNVENCVLQTLYPVAFLVHTLAYCSRRTSLERARNLQFFMSRKWCHRIDGLVAVASFVPGYISILSTTVYFYGCGVFLFTVIFNDNHVSSPLADIRRQS